MPAATAALGPVLGAPELPARPHLGIAVGAEPGLPQGLDVLLLPAHEKQRDAHGWRCDADVSRPPLSGGRRAEAAGAGGCVGGTRREPCCSWRAVRDCRRAMRMLWVCGKRRSTGQLVGWCLQSRRVVGLGWCLPERKSIGEAGEARNRGASHAARSRLWRPLTLRWCRPSPESISRFLIRPCAGCIDPDLWKPSKAKAVQGPCGHHLCPPSHTGHPAKPQGTCTPCTLGNHGWHLRPTLRPASRPPGLRRRRRRRHQRRRGLSQPALAQAGLLWAHGLP